MLSFETKAKDDSSLLISGFLRQHTYEKLIDIFKDNNFIHMSTESNENSEPPNTISLKNIEPYILLIDGYIRRQRSWSTIPEINNLIYSFYQKMNGKSFVWKVNNITELLHKTKTKSIESDIYSINVSFEDAIPFQFLNATPFKFYLSLKRKRTSPKIKNIAKFTIFIRLVSMPHIIEYISFIYQLYCPQLNNYWSNCKQSDKDSLNISLSNDTAQKNISIKHMRSLNLNSLTFYFSFDIIYAPKQKYKHLYNTDYFYNSDLNYLLNKPAENMNHFMMKHDAFKLL
eukprot:282855_1